MAVALEDIKKLRALTGAGLGDCKKALAEANGNMEEAIEIIRKKGQAVAAKRSDREAAEGAVLVKSADGFAAILALKCETDFVAKNEDFIKLAQEILDAAVANKCKSLEEVNALPFGAHTVAEAVTDRSGITGEKMELDGYMFIEGENVSVYDHMGRHMLCTMVQTNKPAEEAAHNVAMQVAAMNPVAVNREGVPASIIEEEKAVAIEKTKSEQVKKAVESALRKAGLNPNHFDSEDHIASNITKGWITEEDAAKAKEIMAKAAEQKAANMPQQMIDNIVNGRINKYYKENVLVEQEYHRDAKKSVQEYLNGEMKGLTVIAFCRVNLNED